MSLRRPRIKGIANIPARRKAETQNVNNDEEQEQESQKIKIETVTEKSNCNENLKIETNVTITSNESNPEEVISVNNCEKDEHRVQNNEIKINEQSDSKITRRWLPKPKVTIPVRASRTKPINKIERESEIKSNENESEIDNTTITVPIEDQNVSTKPVIEDVPFDKSDVTNQSSVVKSLNRSRIKPIPKLIRRSSVQGSASESEDDSRRNRNDSVCSVTNSIPEVNVQSKLESNNVSNQIVKVQQQRKFRRSEQWRKVMEAKRDFNKRFGKDLPDRKQLTMMDLIYYNPVSNPMPPRKQTIKSTPPEELKMEMENISEQNVDDPDEELQNEDEENIPVPQVKVGPNGEIILDEQSLVIEQTGMKKGREEIANSQIVRDDDTDRMYGIYKRVQRAKDWSVSETLRFYRTLNTVGTDFSLMLSLFPGRTRRQLKMKFKKEERINRTLIDKAILNPLQFDLTELEKQLEVDVRPKEDAVKKKKKEKEKVVKVKKQKRKQNGKKTSSLLSSCIDEENGSETPEKKVQKKQTKKSVKTKVKPETDSEEEEEICVKRRRTNYRVESDDENDNNNNIEEEETVNRIIINEEEEETNTRELETFKPTASNEDLSTVEPGSLMILTSFTPQGQQVCKVYMVTPSKTKLPVDLSSDVLQTLTSGLTNNSETFPADEPTVFEVNKTSAANVTELTNDQSSCIYSQISNNSLMNTFEQELVNSVNNNEMDESCCLENASTVTDNIFCDFNNETTTVNNVEDDSLLESNVDNAVREVTVKTDCNSMVFKDNIGNELSIHLDDEGQIIETSLLEIS